MKPNVLLSTGHGDLHFVSAAKALTDAGCDLTLVQNWKPSPLTGRLLDFLGRVFGRRSLIRKQSFGMFPGRVHVCTGSKVLLTLLSMAARMRVLPPSLATRWGWRAYGWQSRRAIRKWHGSSKSGCRIFHVRSGAGQGGAIRQAKALGLKVVVDQSLAHPAFMEKVLGRPWGPDDPFWQLVLKDCDEADLLLVNSEFVKETFVDAGYPEEKIRVVYLGVKGDLFAIPYRGTERTEDGERRITNAPMNSRTNELRTKSREVRLLFTGRFGRRKGADVLLEAVRLLKSNGVSAPLTVVGDCDRESVSILSEAAASGCIQYHRHVPQSELKGFFAASDVYVFPSRAEGCACSGMEAMAAGLCVVATRESGLPITHGVDGLIIPSDDAKALVQQIEWLIENPDLRLRMGEAAMKKIHESLTWERYAERVTEIYSEAWRWGERK